MIFKNIDKIVIFVFIPTFNKKILWRFLYRIRANLPAPTYTPALL